MTFTLAQGVLNLMIYWIENSTVKATILKSVNNAEFLNLYLYRILLKTNKIVRYCNIDILSVPGFSIPLIYLLKILLKYLTVNNNTWTILGSIQTNAARYIRGKSTEFGWALWKEHAKCKFSYIGDIEKREPVLPVNCQRSHIANSKNPFWDNYIEKCGENRKIPSIGRYSYLILS